jgi:AcrR family transcriptional regulator
LHRDELLKSVADFLRTDGLHNFTLRRAAEAAGTTHKVLLYHFNSADELIIEANDLLRAEAVEAAERFLRESAPADLAAALATAWKYWNRMDGDAPLFYQLIGLATADPDRFGEVGRRATRDNVKSFAAHLDADVPEADRAALATLVLAVVRGLAIDRTLTRERARTDTAFAMFTEMATQYVDSGRTQPASARRRSAANH